MMFSLIFILSFFCGTATADISNAPAAASVDIPCDSLYTGKFVDHINEMRDTVINGAEYAWAFPLSDKHTLAFVEYDEKYKSLQYITLLSDGIPFGRYAGTRADDARDQYYGDILPSPSKKYVFYCRYYTTWDIRLMEEGIEEEILKFSCGEILNIETGDIACDLFGFDVTGTWNYCDQWVVEGEVRFDPRETE